MASSAHALPVRLSPIVATRRHEPGRRTSPRQRCPPPQPPPPCQPALFCAALFPLQRHHQPCFGHCELEGGGCGQLQVMGGRIHRPFGPTPVGVRSRSVRFRKASGPTLLLAAASTAFFAVILPPRQLCEPSHASAGSVSLASRTRDSCRSAPLEAGSRSTRWTSRAVKRTSGDGQTFSLVAPSAGAM